MAGKSSVFVALAVLWAGAACGGSDARTDAGARADVGFFRPRDSGLRPDMGLPEDAGVQDADQPRDALPEPDANLTDAGFLDAEPGDAPPIDIGAPDTGPPDTGTPDAGFGDALPGGDAGVVTQGGGLVITEFASRAALEWIEVHNTSAVSIALHTYSLSIFSHAGLGALPIRAPSDPTGASGTVVTLAPGAYALGVANPQNAANIPGIARFVFGAPGQLGGNALADSGDVLTISSPAGSGDTVDFRAAATAPGATPGPGDFPLLPDASTHLDPAIDRSGGELGNDSGAAWCADPFRGPTPNAVNRSCRAFVISEVLYDFDSVATGVDDGQELVEIAGPAGGSLASIVLTLVEGGSGAGTIDEEIAITGSRMPLDGFWVVADDAPNGSGTTSVLNADQITDLVMENGPDALQLIDVSGAGALLDALAYGNVTAQTDTLRNLAIREGAPALDIATGGIYSANLARSDDLADSNDNAADFRYDPSPTPGARNGSTLFTVTSLIQADGLALGGRTATVTFSGTDFTDQMSVSFAQTPSPSLSCPQPTVPNTLTCRVTYPAGGSGTAQRVDVTVTPRQELPQSATLIGGFTWTTAANETGAPGECDFCILQFPTSINVTRGAMTPPIYGQIYEGGRTDTTSGGPAPGILAQIGYGPAGSDPRTTNWSWFPAAFNVEAGNNDEYQAQLVAPGPGAYGFTARFSLDGGLTWSYADSDGAGSNAGLVFSAARTGAMTVN